MSTASISRNNKDFRVLLDGCFCVIPIKLGHQSDNIKPLYADLLQGSHGTRTQMAWI